MFLGLGVGTRGRTRGQSHGLGAINMSGKPIGALDAFSRGSREARRVVVASGMLQRFARFSSGQVIVIRAGGGSIWKIGPEYI